MKNFIDKGTTHLTDADIYGGVDYTISFGTSGDLPFGCTPSAVLKFAIATNTLSLDDNITWSWIPMDSAITRGGGKFIVKDIQKTKTKYKITAYDYMVKFDKVIDSWLAGLTFPMTLKTFATSLCNYCGVEVSTYFSTNENMPVKDNFTSSNITGRTILGYICQASGTNAFMNDNGKLVFKSYSSSSVASYTSHTYRSTEKADYTVAAISQVWVGMEDNDVGVTAGTGDNVYRIVANPLFFANSASEIQTYVTALYTKLSAITYTPMTVEVFDTVCLPGDCFTVNSVSSLLLDLHISSSGIVLKSYGNKERSKMENNAVAQINALRGKYNILDRDIEHTESRIGTAEGNISSLQQTATGFNTRITSAEGNISTLQQTATGLTSRIQTAEGDINSIEQTMQGVAFKSSLADGSTVINGGCITTGTIEAERIELIGWDNLSSACQSRIDQGKGGDYDDSDVRSLLSRTYQITHTSADGTSLQSPTIYAGEIYSGSIYGDNVDLYNTFNIYDTSTGHLCGTFGGGNYGTGSYRHMYITDEDDNARILIQHSGTDGTCQVSMEVNNGNGAITVARTSANNAGIAISAKDYINIMAEYINLGAYTSNVHLCLEQGQMYGTGNPPSGAQEGQIYFKIV